MGGYDREESGGATAVPASPIGAALDLGVYFERKPAE